MIVTFTSPTQDAVFTRLGNFVENVLPGVSFRQGQVNRTPEPTALDFVEGWPISSVRMATNLSSYDDCAFVGSVADDVLTVFNFETPTAAIVPGSELFGVDVVEGTVVTPTLELELNGGALLNASPLNSFVLNGLPVSYSRYTVAPAQNLSARVLATGRQGIEQTAEIVVQLDVHGPAALAHAQTIATMFRDEYAVDFFAAFGDEVSPLHADDARQIPFQNAERQYETRFVVEVHLQVNSRLVISQQFADALTVAFTDATALPA